MKMSMSPHPGSNVTSPLEDDLMVPMYGNNVDLQRKQMSVEYGQ